MRPHISRPTVVCLAVFLAVYSISCGERKGGAIERHREIRKLKSLYDKQRTGDDPAQASETIRKMIAVSPEHPLPYTLIVDQHRTERTYDAAEQELRELGTQGPGLTYGLGRIQFNRDKLEQAEAIFRQALQEYREIGHLPGQGSSHYYLGLTLKKRKKLDEGVVEIARAADFYKRLQDPDSTLILLSARIEIEVRRSPFDKVQPILEEGNALVDQVTDLDSRALWWWNVGRTYSHADRPTDSLEAYRRSAELRRASGNRKELWACLRTLAGKAFTLGAEEEAEEAWAEAIATAEAMGTPDRAVRVQIERGKKYRTTGLPYEAVPILEDAAARARKLDNPHQLPFALDELGAALLSAGSYLEAQATLIEAIELANPAHSRPTKCRINLAASMSRTGNMTGALEQAQIALETARERRYRTQQGTATNNLGHIYHTIGLLDLAQRHFREYVEVSRQTGNVRQEAFARVNLGAVLTDQGLADEAQVEFERALELSIESEDRVTAATSRLWLALIIVEQGRHEDGLRQAEQALRDLREIGDPPRKAAALIVLGSLLLDLGRLDPSYETFAEAAGVARDFGLSERFWVATAGLADVQAARGHPKEALEQYRLTLDAIESLRARLETDEFKMRYLARREEVYEDAIFAQLTLDPGAVSEAFTFAERARARSLSDLLAEARTVMRAELPEEMAKRERELTDAVSSLAQRWTDADSPVARSAAREALEAAEQRLQFFRLEVRREVPRYFDVVYPEPAGLAEIRAEVLDDDEWMLRYFVGTERTLVWVIDRENTRLHELPAPQEIAARVGEYLDCCGRAGVSRPGIEEAEALSLALLPPGLPEKKSLIVVPDGPLYHLPFDLLRQDGKFLVEDYEIQVVPSATMLRVMREHDVAPAPGKFLGVGNPAVADDDERFPPLPYAARALAQISTYFPEPDRVLLDGEDATKAKLREQPLDQFRYVHFATHGLLDRENPRYYGLRLSPSGEGDGSGYLYFIDVFGLRLRSELVVLSACRSGGGELLRGEGLVGMTGAFLYAGSRSVLVSLWNVNDRSTAEFMMDFYAEIAEGRTIQDALRRTKLAFLRSDRPARRQPYRWAPFVLVGDPGTN